MNSTVDRQPAQPGSWLEVAFAPVHKRALGVAVGSLVAFLVFGATALHVVLRPGAALDIGLLSQYFYGYTVSWQGSVVGAFWGFFTGFVAGWFLAFVRNLVMTVAVFTLRTKAELARTSDFLDHI